MKTRTLSIGGMSCVNCQERIERKLRAAPGVESAAVSYSKGRATVTYNPDVISLDTIEAMIEALDYQVLEDGAKAAPAVCAPNAGRTVGLLVIIVALAVLFDRFGVSLFSAFPTAEKGMSLGFMFIIGLITSLHCVAMCGGINLSQTLGAAQTEGGSSNVRTKPNSLVPSLLYNGGRVISYTVIGGVVGALGAVFSLSGGARGLVQLAAGIFMVIMGVNMLGIFPFLRVLTPRLPRALSERFNALRANAVRGGRGYGPLIIGLLNGFMPCGPLQAMQIYALSTGSPVKGAAAMLLFALGTVPLMFGLGALSTALGGAKKGAVFTRRVMTAGACVITVMGITMFFQGAALSGISLSSFVPETLSLSTPAGVTQVSGASDRGGEGVARIENGVQIINTTLSPGRYPALTVQAGLPVRWTIDAPAGSINGCNRSFVIPEYNIQYSFRQGENVVEFLPAKTGKFRYACWMGMIRSSITVVADAAALRTASAELSAADSSSAPVPAGYTIPVASVALPEFDDYQGNKIQRIRVALTDEGFSPALAVVQAGIPAAWVIDNQSLEDGSAEIRVPLYQTALPLEKQAENPLFLPQPDEDFVFSTGDSIFFGYMKVVDNIEGLDLEAVKTEAANIETLVYPDEYYAAVSTDGGCCGRAY